MKRDERTSGRCWEWTSPVLRSLIRLRRGTYIALEGGRLSGYATFMGEVDADGFYDLLTGRLARL